MSPRSEEVRGLNPRLLAWARERAGLSVSDVADALGKETADVQAWEAGEAAPTYVQLETLAYRILKRPIALFFFPEPPPEPDPRQSFRTLPDAEIENLKPDTRYRIRDARAKQLALAELAEGRNPAERQILRELQVSEDSRETAQRLRNYLNVPLDVQTEVWRNSDEALKKWRVIVESVGVFVFKHSLKQRDIFGFSLFDFEFPLIVLNNSSTVTRQIFTLFHELSHLLLEVGGITKADDRYVLALSGERRRVEVFVNKLAADFLAPRESVRAEVERLGTDDDAVGNIAEAFKVSREVILRRLLDMRLVTRERYNERVAQWTREFEQAAEARRESGGNYYYTHATYLSERYARLAFSSFYRGAISTEQLADYLNISVKSIPGIEQTILQRTLE